MRSQDITELITPGALARAAATGLAGAALSVEHRPRLVRGLGLATAVGVGAYAALAASGAVPAPGVEEGEEPLDLSPGAAAALGLGIFALTAGASEVGVRAQGSLERWAARVNGHPRLTIGVLTGALSLAVDVAEQVASSR